MAEESKLKLMVETRFQELVQLKEKQTEICKNLSIALREAEGNLLKIEGAILEIQAFLKVETEI